MPRECSVCAHPERARIEDALAAGEPLRAIAGRFGTSPPSLIRHKIHRQAPVAGGADEDAPEPEGEAMTTREETRAMDTQADPVAEAREHVRELHQAEHSMAEQLERVRADLATMRERAGAAALAAHLAGSDPAAAVDGLAALLAREHALTAGLKAARTGRIAAIKNVWTAEAAAKRAAAAEVRVRLAEHMTKRNALLEQLRQLEETPAAPVLSWNLDGHTDGTPHGRMAAVPLSERLDEQARGLVLSANSLEDRRDPPDSGTTGGNTISDLIERTDDPLHVAPAPAAIRAWATEAVAAARIPAGEPAFFHVEWRGGALIPSACTVRRA